MQAARAVADGRAQALVCAGGTGAALAAGTFNIKRAPRHLPPGARDPDAGSRPSGDAAGRRRQRRGSQGAPGAVRVHGRRARADGARGAAPRVGAAVQRRGGRARQRARASKRTRSCASACGRQAVDAFEFVGNVEGGDVVSGRADVIVTDGFTGNIALKLMEGVSQTMLGAIRAAAMSSTRGKLGGALLRGRARRPARGARSGGQRRRLPAGSAPPGRRAARALHARRLRAGDPARAARRARGHRRADARRARAGRRAQARARVQLSMTSRVGR